MKYSSIVYSVYQKSLNTKIKPVIPWRKAHVNYLSDYATCEVSVSLCNSFGINTFLSKHKHKKKYYSYWLQKQCCLVTIYLTNNSAKQRPYSSKTSLSNTPALQVLLCMCVVTHRSSSFDFSTISLTAFTFQNAFFFFLSELSRWQSQGKGSLQERSIRGIWARLPTLLWEKGGCFSKRGAYRRSLTQGFPINFLQSVQPWLLFRRLAYEKAQSQMPKAQVKTMLHYSQCLQTRNWST